MEPTLVIIGLSHRTAPIDVRERFWMNEQRQQDALAALTRAEGIDEAFVFSTCNRTEFALWGDPTLAENSVLRFLSSHYELKLCEWKNFYRLLDEQALAHAFRVSCGLDSMHIGEGRLGRQVNAAWEQARSANSTGPFLDALVKKALAVRRQVHRETATAFNLHSAPHAAVELAAGILGSLARRGVAVLGAGAMARAAAQSMCERGVEAIWLLDRSDSRALDFTCSRVHRAPFSERYQHLVKADLVISATGADGFVLTADELCQTAVARAGRKQVIMDLALPRDVDPLVRRIHGIVLYDLDDLERSVKPRAESQESEAEAENIVLAQVRQFRTELAALNTNSKILDLHHRLDEICRQELESFRQEMGPFPKDQDQLLAAVSARITNKIAGSLVRARAFGSRL